jgi:hypothetical protein
MRPRDSPLRYLDRLARLILVMALALYCGISSKNMLQLLHYLNSSDYPEGNSSNPQAMI